MRRRRRNPTPELVYFLKLIEGEGGRGGQGGRWGSRGSGVVEVAVEVPARLAEGPSWCLSSVPSGARGRLRYPPISLKAYKSNANSNSASEILATGVQR